MKHTASARSAGVIAAAALMTTTLGVPVAVGATTSVEGTGLYEKLVLANNQSAVVIKAYGPGPFEPCHWSVNARFRDRDGTVYTVTRGCYEESTYATSLSRGSNLKACDGLTGGYNATGGFWRFSVPRSCLTALANTIKVTKSVMNIGSASPSEAGPTPYVARG
jgi:hypothetical protein